MGLVDLHCHILWDLDDGCRSPRETLRAARTLVSAGYSEAVPTPHAQRRYGGGDASLSRDRLSHARALLAAEGIGLLLHDGAENLLDEELLARAGSGEARGIGATGRYVLVEVPFQERVPALPELVRRLLAKRLVPVLAHPERCQEFVEDGRAEEVVRLGAALQLNLGALTGRHGRGARELAERFLDAGLYAVAGTDLHSPEGAEEWIGEALETLAERAGAACVRRLCEENPRKALAGDGLS
jgi:protein-tyrosine phosphatase